jgi:hypothetical protein
MSGGSRPWLTRKPQQHLLLSAFLPGLEGMQVSQRRWLDLRRACLTRSGFRRLSTNRATGLDHASPRREFIASIPRKAEQGWATSRITELRLHLERKQAPVHKPRGQHIGTHGRRIISERSPNQKRTSEKNKESTRLNRIGTLFREGKQIQRHWSCSCLTG